MLCLKVPSYTSDCRRTVMSRFGILLPCFCLNMSHPVSDLLSPLWLSAMPWLVSPVNLCLSVCASSVFVSLLCYLLCLLSRLFYSLEFFYVFWNGLVYWSLIFTHFPLFDWFLVLTLTCLPTCKLPLCSINHCTKPALPPLHLGLPPFCVFLVHLWHADYLVTLQRVCIK